MSVAPSASPPAIRRTGWRAMAGVLLAATGLAGLTAVLVPSRADIALASVVLLYLVVVVMTAVVGGLASSLGAAIASDLVVNFFFVPPYHTLTVESQDHVITLVVYIAVAITVSLAMDLAARQRAAAARTGIEAELMARISAEPVREGSVRSLLAHVRDVLHMDTAAIIETAGNGTKRVVAIDGRDLTGAPTLSVPAAANLTLVVEGPPLFAPDPKFLTRLAAAAARTLQAERLAAEAAQARELAEIDRRGPAHRRRPRPAHAAGRHQGRRVQPARSRPAPDRPPAGRTPRHYRGVRRSHGRPRGEPPSDEPTSSWGTQRPAPPNRPR